jgi:hypothetical protein
MGARGDATAHNCCGTSSLLLVSLSSAMQYAHLKGKTVSHRSGPSASKGCSAASAVIYPHVYDVPGANGWFLEDI